MKRQCINLAHPAKDQIYVTGIIKHKYIMHTKAHRITYNSETIKNWQEKHVTVSHSFLMISSNQLPRQNLVSAFNVPEQSKQNYTVYTTPLILCKNLD